MTKKEAKAVYGFLMQNRTIEEDEEVFKLGLPDFIPAHLTPKGKAKNNALRVLSVVSKIEEAADADDNY